MINNKLLGLLGICAKAGKITSGADACLEDMKTNKLKLLILSEDASDKTKKNYIYYANKYNVPVIIIGNNEDLSKAVGKKNRAIIGIKDSNLSIEIQKITNGGEIIG